MHEPARPTAGIPALPGLTGSACAQAPAARGPKMVQSSDVMLEIYETRRRRLGQLIKARCGGSNGAFAQQTGLHLQQVSDLLQGRQNFGERLSRHIEGKLKLSPYWFDGLDLGRRKKPRRDPVSPPPLLTPKPSARRKRTPNPVHAAETA